MPPRAENIGIRVGMGVAALFAGAEMGIINANFKGANNIVDSQINIDRRQERRLDVADFPAQGFNAYVEEMAHAKVELKDRVFTVKGEAEGDGKFSFRGEQASGLCKQANFELKTIVTTNSIEFHISAKDRRGEDVIIRNLPPLSTAGLGLFLEGTSDVKVGCDVLVNDGVSDNVLVVRYKDRGHIVVDGSPAFKSQLGSDTRQPVDK